MVKLLGLHAAHTTRVWIVLVVGEAAMIEASTSKESTRSINIDQCISHLHGGVVSLATAARPRDDPLMLGINSLSDHRHALL